MRDETLTILIVLATTLSLGHTADHIIRGDLHWPLTLESVPFMVVNLAIYTFIALGLYFYSRNRVGPGFWAIFGSIAVAFGWLAHFSPFTDQPARSIVSSYKSVVAGWLAFSCLIALMLVLIVAAGYAGYLWIRRPSS